MSETRTVRISNLSSSTSKEGLSAFLGFCGTIESIDIQGTSATVVFAKESAAKTAELLDQGTLDGSTLSISGSAQGAHSDDDVHGDGDISQEHKPRSAVVAEILSHGYVLADTAIEKAIALDNTYGISKRFLSFFKPLSNTVTEKVVALDQQHQISEKAKDTASQTDAKLNLSEKTEKAKNIGKQYYSSALSSPFGARVQAFYTETQKQIVDVHEVGRNSSFSVISDASSCALPTGSSPHCRLSQACSAQHSNTCRCRN